MRFDILTIFPGMFAGYLDESIIKRGRERGLLDIRVHDLRRWAEGKHRKVDDRPFGGGPGMVMAVGPFFRALKSLRALTVVGPARNSLARAVPEASAGGRRHPGSTSRTRIILLSAKGKTFTHKEAIRLAKYDRLVLLCGRYEGVDERVAAQLADEELSIGNYVLTGGELPALVVVDAVSRHIPGVLGKAASLEQESHIEEGVTEYPQYTRPEIFAPKRGEKWKVPPILLSGDHKKIAEWRQKKRKTR